VTDEARQAVRDHALGLGFDAVGVTRAKLAQHAKEQLAEFVESGYHGDMGWLADKIDRRGDPQSLWSGARSIIVLAKNYGPDCDPLEGLGARDSGNLSVYARNRDYHDTMKKRLKALARWMVEKFAAEVKVFVDTAPVMEKPIAASAGIGWQGKHTNLVSRQFGSWLFLGEIFTSLDLSPDAEEKDHCGECRRCLDVCPTNAFPAPYRLDARRCISYLTIEHKDPIPRELRSAIGNRIYGCDDCLAVCPWNKFAKVATEPDFLSRSDLVSPNLAVLAALDDAAFRQMFSGSPIKRIGRDRFVRNVVIAMGNSGIRTFREPLIERLADPSALVRGAAVWALSCLEGPQTLKGLRSGPGASECDIGVLQEWNWATGSA
jgi:epoxyqueuosine reductase